MRKTIFIFILFCTFNFANGQITKKRYFSRGHNYSTVYSYFVSELILFSDSTFVENNYSVPNKKQWKNYKKFDPQKRKGQITKECEFYILTEIINGKKSDIIDYIKVTNQMVSFYLKHTNGTFEKVFTMKRKL